MTRIERDRCLRWRFGWLPLGKPQPCPFHPSELFNKRHSIQCLQMHTRLFLPQTIEDPLSFLPNKLPQKTKKIPELSITAWLIRWPVICSILYEMNIWPITNSQFLLTIPVIFLSNNSPQIDPNFWYIYYHPLIITFYFCIFPIIPIGFFFYPLSLFDMSRANKAYQRCYVPTGYFY